MAISKVFFIADLHFGHKNILKFAEGKRQGATIEEHDEWIIAQWNSVVMPRDQVYLLGDVAFGSENLRKLERLNGQIHLLPGNHDTGAIDKYEGLVCNVISARKFRGMFWISHIPIHPSCLQDRFCVHGHVHQHSLKDLNYINVSVEAVNGIPVSLEEINKIITDRTIAMIINKGEING